MGGGSLRSSVQILLNIVSIKLMETGYATGRSNFGYLSQGVVKLDLYMISVLGVFP